jgi:hypothetical protein
LFFLMYSHILLTTSERASGSLPTTAASSAEGFSGFMKAALGDLAIVFLRFRARTAMRC